MTTTELKPVTSDQLNLRYNALVGLINKSANDAQSRVSAHIRAITDGRHASIAIYHVASSISKEEKHEEYARIASALGLKKDGGGKPMFTHPDWSQLQGQVGLGAKKAEADEPEQALVTQVGGANDGAPVPTTATTPAPRKIKPATSEPDKGDLAEILARALQSHLQTTAGDIDEGQVRLIVREEIESMDLDEVIKKANANGAFPLERVQKLLDDALAKSVQRIEIILPNGETQPVDGLVHPQVTQLATYLQAGVPVWGYSAAGSGKTHMARQIAPMLGVEPYVISVDPTLTVSKLLGYRNITNGDFVEGFLYKAFKSGGVVALDEIDTGDPGVIASINAMLSNTHYLFPNGETVQRHQQFYALALANTRGTGAVAGYTARNKLDAATLDRFAIVEVKYDAGLEMALAIGEGQVGAMWKAGEPASKEIQKSFVEWVQKVREYVKESVLISPRASINGCKLLRAGVPMNEVVMSLVFKLCSTDTISRIKDQCGLPEGTV